MTKHHVGGCRNSMWIHQAISNDFVEVLAAFLIVKGQLLACKEIILQVYGDWLRICVQLYFIRHLLRIGGLEVASILLLLRL